MDLMQGQIIINLDLFKGQMSTPIILQVSSFSGMKRATECGFP